METNLSKKNEILNEYKEEVVVMNGTDAFSPEELVETIKKREQQSKAYYLELKKIAEDNTSYYLGNQVDENKLYVGETPVVVNRILPTIETIIPIVTDKTPEPQVTVLPETKTNLALQEKIERKLHDIWTISAKMQSKLERLVRNLACNRYACIKGVYDEVKEEVDFVVMPAGKIFFPAGYADVDSLPYIGEYVELTLNDLLVKFALNEDGTADTKARDKIFEALNQDYKNLSRDTKITIIEYWEKEYVAWKYKDLLLGYAQNPNFDFSDVEGKVINHYKEPKYPYFFLNLYNWGDSIVDKVSMVELITGLQDNINARKRQIELNAKMANGRLIFAGNKISKEAATEITNEPDERIWLEGADDTQGVSVLTGRALDQGIYLDMQDSKAEIDTILGVHGTTRGERGAEETAAGRQILKTSDITRQRTIVRAFERLAKDIYDYMIQCMYVHYTTPHYVSGLDNAENMAQTKEKMRIITQAELRKVKVDVQVIDGSIVPRDKEEMKREAMQLAAQKMMSLKDMYRILEYPDADKLARNAIYEQIDPSLVYGDPARDMQYNYKAITALMRMQKEGVFDPSSYVVLTDNIQAMGTYLSSLGAFIKGEELHYDLIPFAELPMDTQAGIIEVFEKQKEITEAKAAEMEESMPVVPEEEDGPLA